MEIIASEKSESDRMQRLNEPRTQTHITSSLCSLLNSQFTPWTASEHNSTENQSDAFEQIHDGVHARRHTEMKCEKQSKSKSKERKNSTMKIWYEKYL